MVEYIIYGEELPTDEKELVKVVVSNEEKELMEKLLEKLEEISASPIYRDDEIAAKLAFLQESVSKLVSIEKTKITDYEETVHSIKNLLEQISIKARQTDSDFSKRMSVLADAVNKISTGSLENAMTEKIESMSLSMERIIELLSATNDVYRMFGQKNADGIQSLFDRITSMDEKLTSINNETIESLNKEIATVLMNAQSITLDAIDKIEQKLTENNSSLEQTLLRIVEAMEKFAVLSDTIEDFSSYFDGMQKINERIVSILKENHEVFNAKLSSIEETSMAHINNITSRLDVIEQNQSSIIEAVQPMNKDEMIEEIRTGLTKMRDHLEDKQRELGDNIEKRLSGIMSRVVEMERKIETSELDSKLEHATNLINERISDMKAAMKNNDSLYENMENKISSLVSSLQETGNRNYEELTNTVGELEKAIKNFSDIEMISSIAEKIKDVENRLSETTQEEKLREEIKNELADIKRKIAEMTSIDELGDEIKTVHKLTSQLINESESRINDSIRELTKDIANDKKNLRESIEAIKENVESLSNEAGDSDITRRLEEMKKDISSIKNQDTESELKRMVFAIQLLQEKHKELMVKMEQLPAKAQQRAQKTYTRARNTKQKRKLVRKTRTVSSSRAETRQALTELADSSILNLLRNTTRMNTIQIINGVPVSKSLAKKRIAMLNREGRIKRKKEGRNVFYYL